MSRTPLDCRAGAGLEESRQVKYAGYEYREYQISVKEHGLDYVPVQIQIRSPYDAVGMDIFLTMTLQIVNHNTDSGQKIELNRSRDLRAEAVDQI